MKPIFMGIITMIISVFFGFILAASFPKSVLFVDNSLIKENKELTEKNEKLESQWESLYNTDTILLDQRDKLTLELLKCR